MALHIDEDNILQPLGVSVLRDSRFELLPGTREHTEEIPGRHGEIDFGAEFRSRILELHCVLEVDPSERATKMVEIANYLNPLKGAQPLTFASDPGKVCWVRYAGKIEPDAYSSWSRFTIPFKMTNPFIVADTESALIGSGVAFNGGDIDAPCLVEIKGSITNPSVTINDKTMKYTGLVTASDVLLIDTEAMTATFNGVNAMVNYNKAFPMLEVGNNTITVSGGTVTVKWRNRWTGMCL